MTTKLWPSNLGATVVNVASIQRATINCKSQAEVLLWVFERCKCDVSLRNAFNEHFGPGGFSGATFGDWMRALRDNRFAIDAKFWPRAALISGNSVINSLARYCEALRYGAAIADTLVRVAHGRTAIVITHRPSLARIAHQTVTL